jgi:predicted dinucleotide-binding enzyme
MASHQAQTTVAIVGAGNVGKALAAALVRAGAHVIFGVRDTAKTRDLSVPAVGIDNAINLASIVIMAVPYIAALELAGSIDDWKGRILVDATNPVLPDHSGLMLGTHTSGAEEIAKLSRGARVVKAFSCTFPSVLENAGFTAGQPFMPICGDDPVAVREVISLARSIGLDGVNVGGLHAARYIEPFTMLSVSLLFAGESRGFAFTKMSR